MRSILRVCIVSSLLGAVAFGQSAAINGQISGTCWASFGGAARPDRKSINELGNADCGIWGRNANPYARYADRSSM
jgi:hypothetical protein